ncbi:hypothetical protein I4U23_013829 [Adineta vaga]|nr:hypothetical protein I4U23_013829 [Adineta vaga]
MISNNTKAKLADLKHDFIQLGWKIVYDWSFSLSALIGYSLLISLLPLILCLFAIVSLIFNGDPAIEKSIRDRLVEAFPEGNLTDVVDTLVKSISNQAGLVFFVTFVVSVFGGSRLLICIDDVLTIVYRLRERTVLNQNIHAIKLLLAFFILIPVLMISASAPAIIIKGEGWYHFASALSSGILGFLVFELAYIYVPDRTMSFHNTWCGSLFAAVGLQVIFVGFPIYVHNFMTNYVGQLGVVIVTVLFFYICGLLLIVGAQINAYFYDHIQPLPVSLGTLLSRTVDQENRALVDNNLQITNDMLTLKEGFNPVN